MSEIQRLSTIVANQIAAGQVIEGPGSIVKELLENSIDADARHIVITLEDGGLTEITVRDDGCGIPADSLPLACERHATSKTRTTEDLQRIGTLGFRGEALASIAAVSTLTCISRVPEQDVAYSLKLSPQEAAAPSLQASAHPVGTSIIVRDLFSTLPARKQFLRTARTELLAVEHVVKQMAFVYRQIGFQLINNKKMLLNFLPEQGPEQRRLRLRQWLGQRVADAMIEIDDSYTDLRLQGWFSPPTLAKTQSTYQFFYVNGRAVQDKVIIHALKQAYASFYPEGKYPIYILDLHLPLEKVDVNVHPMKQSLRFTEARMVHDFLLAAVKRALSADVQGSLTFSDEKSEKQVADQSKLLDPLEKSAPLLPSAFSITGTTGMIGRSVQVHEKMEAFLKKQDALKQKGQSAQQGKDLLVPSFADKNRQLQSELPCVNSQENARSSKLIFHTQAIFSDYALLLHEIDYYALAIPLYFSALLSDYMDFSGFLKGMETTSVLFSFSEKMGEHFAAWQSYFAKMHMQLERFSMQQVILREMPTFLSFVDWQALMPVLLKRAVCTEMYLKTAVAYFILPKDFMQLDLHLESGMQIFSEDILVSSTFLRKINNLSLSKLFS